MAAIWKIAASFNEQRYFYAYFFFEIYMVDNVSRVNKRIAEASANQYARTYIYGNHSVGEEHTQLNKSNT
jgi:hypothetical protein